MKRLIFILVMLLPAIMSQALTVDGLFKKYKKIPEAQYVKMNKKDLMAQMDSVDSEEEKEMLRTAKGMQMLLVNLDDDEKLEQITNDLNSLKNYSLAVSFTRNNGPQTINLIHEDGSITKETIKESMSGFISSLFNPTIAVDVYGKETASEDIISKPLFLIKFWNFTGLIYIDGEININDAETVTNFVDFDTDSEITIKIESEPSSGQTDPTDQPQPSDQED